MTPYEWRYDLENKTGYLKLKEDKVASTLELTEGVMIDRALDGSVIGVEIIK